MIMNSGSITRFKKNFMSETTIKIIKTTDRLPLMEAFHTIQGEGYHQGKSAYFIRLGGCDVGCHWCDVKESWDASLYPKIKISNIVSEAATQPSNIVVVTGGEPLMYDLSALTDELKSCSFQTHLETSGAYPVSGRWDWICFSPKKFKKPQPDIYRQANELKVVIYNRSDFTWAEQHAALVDKQCHLYLQPEWSKREIMIPQVVDYVKQHPKWHISLQIHKYMHIP